MQTSSHTALGSIALFFFLVVAAVTLVGITSSAQPSSFDSSGPSAINDLHVPDNCNSFVQLHDHVMLDIHLKFANGTIFQPLAGTFQLIHAKLDNIDQKPILKAIKGMCKNSTRELRFESAYGASFEPFTNYIANQHMFSYDADEAVSMIVRVHSITTTSDYQIFDVIHNKDLGMALDLLNSQTGVNAVDEWGQSALMLAISNKIVPIVAGLINARMPKIEINYAKPNGKTALFYVIESKDQDTWLMNAMLRRGADPNVALISDGARGNTPLHYACLLGMYHHAEMLLEYGANPSAMNEHGQLPMNLINPQDLTPTTRAKLKKAFDAAFQKEKRLSKEEL